MNVKIKNINPINDKEFLVEYVSDEYDGAMEISEEKLKLMTIEDLKEFLHLDINDFKIYKSDFRYFIEFRGNEGEIKFGRGEHGGESYDYVDYIEWESIIPENWEQIESFVEGNLEELINNAEKI